MIISPMLAELGDPSSLDSLLDEDWIVQPKYDGERIIAQWDNGRVALWTRRDINVAKKFPEVVDSMAFLRGKKQTVLDGELIVGKGHEDLMTRQSEDPLTVKVLSLKFPSKYIVFDLLILDGESIMERPLSIRRQILHDLIGEKGRGSIFLCPSYSAKEGRTLFDRQISEGREGIMAKRLTSRYLAGKRSSDWLKFKNTDVVEVEVIGARKSETGQPFASLITTRNGKYFGCVGSGFSNVEKTRILEFLRRHETKKSVVEIPRDVEPLILTQPIAAEVKVNAILVDGSPRAPVWVGFKKR